MTFPEEIRTARKSLGLTQRGFAAAFGLANKTVQNWESGRCMPTGLALSGLRDKLAKMLAMNGKDG